MAAQLVPTHQRRRVRNLTIAAGVAALIAVGGYAATTTFGPDAYEPQPGPANGDTATATDQVLRELRESLAGQYGSSAASATGDSATPSDEAMRQLRETIINLYGPAPSTSGHHARQRRGTARSGS
jgi:hypothetical protein